MSSVQFSTGPLGATSHTNSTHANQPLQKHACTACSKRKIRCDRHEPCSACVKSKSPCLFQEPAPSRRHRKRPAEDELLARLNRYEDLMRAKNIDFAAYDASNTTTWIPSSQQARLDDNQRRLGRGIPLTSEVARSSMEDVGNNMVGDRSLWVDLSSELQNPPQQRLSFRSFEGPESSSPSDPSPAKTNNESALLFALSPFYIDLTAQHPEPGRIFRLWHIFLDRTNPLIKIVHAPTLQTQILEASVNLRTVPKSTEALMFAVYLLAVTSLSATECESLLGESRSVLITKYRDATRAALIANDLMSTRDFEVLQAFALYMAADMDSSPAFLLSAVAIRLAIRMDIHRQSELSKLPFFEEEMRTRLWWWLMLLDARLRFYITGPSLATEFSDLRLPLNVNDSDLHPNMVEPPTQHVGTTEMLYPLMKYEVQVYRRKLNSMTPAAEAFKAERDSLRPLIKTQFVDEIERNYEEKYLRYCDPQIPLHFVCITMARLAIVRIRFLRGHPRNRPDGGTQMLPEESDALFASSIKLLELDIDGRKTKFAPQLLQHMTARSQLDAYIYTISELRRRTSGPLITKAWDLVGTLFQEHPELITDTENTFYMSLSDLTLVAWEARQADLVHTGAHSVEDITPDYIKALRASRQQRIKGGEPTSEETESFLPPSTTASEPSQALDGDQAQFETMNNMDKMITEMAMPTLAEDVDWAYWDQFLEAPQYGL